ncbi:alphan-acetylglucosamine transferase [Fusarium beomiforme]|uniref:Alphan-acetylglucosamine transferase n=1 Tax=Fusarium beomiforme TaxID=44412 RepID=A0A9P5AQR1_9HYPO|nr:alphan-acetylglucosamine transferase [Fusarium beomiforme]
MAVPVTAWKPLFIYRSDEALCPSHAHIVGPSPHPLLLEVAVPLYTVVAKPYVVVSQDIRVSIDHLITSEKKDQLGYIGAYQEVLLKFVSTAREGIRRHGTSLGDYYRHRYPNLRSWIEYAVLLQDLPSANLPPHSSKGAMDFRDSFARAASFLAFDVMRPHEAISEELQQMDSSQIVARIRKSLKSKLYSSYDCPPQDHAIVSHVRHVLICISGRGNRAQLELLGSQVSSIDLSLTFRYLIGGGVNVREHSHVNELVQQMSSAQVFVGSTVDLNVVQEFFNKLSLEQWLTTRHLPDSWVSGLSLQQRKSFEALMGEASALFGQARHPYNIQKLFIIWTYTQGSSAISCQEEIKRQFEQLFHVAARHLAESKSQTQIVLDAMTLFCITKLFREHEPRTQISDTLGRFDAIFNTGRQKDTPVVLDYCLLSLHRVLIASDFLGRSVHLANFIAQLELPQLMLGVNDGHIDLYWSHRLRSCYSHRDALNATYQQVGLSVKLAPLQLHHPPDRKASEDCIIVKVDAVTRSRGRNTPVSLEDEMETQRDDEQDLLEVINMAMKMEAKRQRKPAPKELRRSTGSQRLGKRYKHNQLASR